MDRSFREDPFGQRDFQVSVYCTRCGGNSDSGHRPYCPLLRKATVGPTPEPDEDRKAVDSMTFEEVKAELDSIGIDVKPLHETVKALLTRERARLYPAAEKKGAKEGNL